MGAHKHSKQIPNQTLFRVQGQGFKFYICTTGQHMAQGFAVSCAQLAWHSWRPLLSCFKGLMQQQTTVSHACKCAQLWYLEMTKQRQLAFRPPRRKKCSFGYSGVKCTRVDNWAGFGGSLKNSALWALVYLKGIRAHKA